MKSWTDIASDLKANRRFESGQGGQRRARLQDPLRQADKGVLTNKRILPTMLQSRTNEEFGECEQLFEDFLSQVNDFGEKKDVIEESSVMMLKLEMEAKDASDGSESGTPLQRTSVVDVLQHITTAVDNVTGEDTCLKMVTSFLKDRLEQEDMREVKRSRRED
ncbi:hypothetical protein AaE_007610 [Aphanomyces astaci]|uniref:Uncharacterized protein n=1 Tax=Aphanomyces astaci TaxID=112090 RepID=A0A6A5AH21_APHAT|nr:hypothetical protein AaE_007610 [Aphanomyces astaci]